MKKNKSLKVSIVMGSQSDYKVMHLAEKTLKKIGVPFETKIISAHRTPKRMYDYAIATKKKSYRSNYSWSWWFCSFTRNDICINIFTSTWSTY